MHNEPMIYGYARVSIDGQSVNTQVRQLASTINGQPLGLAKYAPEPWTDAVCMQSPGHRAVSNEIDVAYGPGQ